MKQCPYCGEACPDEATECPTDRTPFPVSPTDGGAAAKNIRLLKSFVWLSMVMFLTVCFACWVASSLLKLGLRKMHDPADFPVFVRLVLYPNIWMLFLPAPWLAYAAALSFRRDFPYRQILLFAGTIAMVIILLLGIIFAAAISATYPRPIH